MASPQNNPSIQTQPSDVCNSELVEPIQFFCRIRTSKTKNLVSKVSKISPQMLSLTIPLDHAPNSTDICFLFDNIYTTSTAQEEFCKETVLPLLKNLLDGNDGIAFVFGTEDVNRTFILKGTTSNPGILPWCIDSLFNTIQNHQLKKCLVVPIKANEFKIISEKAAARARQLEHKKKTKNCRIKSREKPKRITYVNKGVYIREIDSCSNYTIFVSYIQIYNNIVFDLLDEANGTNSRGKKLKEDRNGKCYVEDIVEIEVRTPSEAYSLLDIGEQCKLRYQSLLSKEFSRGYTVFNIRTVHAKEGKVNKENLKVGQLSLVDLSGWNRFDSEDDRETRLDEIFSVQRCIQSLKHDCGKNRRNPVLSGDHVLMSLFRSHFVGNSKIHVITCIDPHVQGPDEIFESMRFSDYRPFEMYKYQYPPRFSPKRVKHQIDRFEPNLQSFLPEPRPSPIVEFNFGNVEASTEVARKMIEVLDCKHGNASLYDFRFNSLKTMFRQRLVDIRRHNVNMMRESHELRMVKKHAIEIEPESPTFNYRDDANFCEIPCSGRMNAMLDQLDEGIHVDIECQSNNLSNVNKYKNAMTQTMTEDMRNDDLAVIQGEKQETRKTSRNARLEAGLTLQVLSLKSKL